MKRIITGFIIIILAALAFSAPRLKKSYNEYQEYKLRSGFGKLSFSQRGEDLVIKGIFEDLGIKTPSYVDIGAWDPVRDSNTFLFYQNGSRGLLVEPNPFYAQLLENVRKEDQIISYAIGKENIDEVNYYVIDDGKSGWNTFSSSQADIHRKNGHKITIHKKRQMTINKLLDTYLKKAPNLLSIDAEGLDLLILQTLDWERYRPGVICVETVYINSLNENKSIHEYLQKKDYSLRGSTLINSIFVDNRLLRR